MEIATKVGVKQSTKLPLFQPSVAMQLEKQVLSNGETQGRRSEEEAAEALEHSPHFEILANVVWAEIGRSLMDEMGAVIFSAGRPAEFKKVCSYLI